MSSFTPEQQQELANLMRREFTPQTVLVRQAQADVAAVAGLWEQVSDTTIRAPWTAVVQSGGAKFDTSFVIADEAGDTMLEFFKGGAESDAAAGDTPGTLRLPAGDIINVRNVQGGVYLAGHPALLNLDLGAGAGDSTPGSHTGDGKRGNIGLNYDVGCGTIIYDGRAAEGGTTIHQVAAFNQTSDNTTGNGLVQMWRPLVLRAKVASSGSSDVAINTGLQAESNPQWQVLQDGTMSWGTGGGAGDVNLYRYGYQTLKTDQNLHVGSSILVGGNQHINGWLEVGGSCSAGSYITTSDRRLKTKVRPLGPSLEKVNALAPVTYQWSKDSDGVGTNLGLIAQDVQAVVPDAVKASPTDEMPDRLGIDYNALVPLLIGAVQELSAEVADLRARIGA